MSSCLALLLANVRYWSTVAPRVRAQLHRWERRARAIEDPVLRDLALGKLAQERFNVELAATAATLADPRHRRDAAEAIVALQVAYDYLDVLSERSVVGEPPRDPPSGGRRLFQALVDSLGQSGEPHGDYYLGLPHSRDGGYLRELVDTVRRSLEALPATGTIAAVARGAAERCAQAQALSHTAAARGETAELVAWATREANGTGLQWREFLAGAAASVLAVHALIAAAGNPPTTRHDTEAIDAAYLPICALSMLDSLLDREEDIAGGQLNYADLYDTPEQMALALADVARDARSRVQALPDAAHHLLTLTGVVAYYASAPAARSPRARPVMVAVRGQLRGPITPTLALMRGWRLAKRWRSAVAAGVSFQGTRRR